MITFKIIGIIILISFWTYFIIIRNPLDAYLYTHNWKFTWIVFKAQFTMNEFEFANRIWSHPLNKSYKENKTE